MRENELLESKELREQLKDRIEVLNRVKALLLMPGTEWATTEQVASYYGVTNEVIRQIAVRNNDELSSDGMRTITGDELRDMKSLCGIKSRAASMTVFPTRAILRVGMLLRDSEVAKEVRTQLLNTVEKVSDDIKTEEIDNEKDLIFAVVTAKDDTERLMALGKYHAYVARYKEKANYYDKVLHSDNLVTTTSIAKDLGMSARKLNGLLHTLGIIFKQNDEWFLYAKYQHLVPEMADYHVHEHGQTLKWTEKGRKYIIDLLKENELITV